MLVEDVKDGQNAKVSVHFVLLDSYYYPYSSANLEQFLPEVCVGPASTYIYILASDDSIIRCQYFPVYDC